MNYDEIDAETVNRAVQECLKSPSGPALALMIAKMAREQGPVPYDLIPPDPIDPDIAEAKEVWLSSRPCHAQYIALAGIKRGRALAAEAKPGMVWVKHDGGKSPIADWDTQVAVIYDDGTMIAGDAHNRAWSTVTLYAIITPPTEAVA